MSRLISLVLVGGIAMSGCSSWRTLEAPLPDTEFDGKLVVNLHNGRSFILKGARACGDTLYGSKLHEELKVDEGGVSTARDWQDIAILEERIESVEEKKFSLSQTLGLAVGVIAIVGAVVACANYRSPSFETGPIF